eukprot:TRINITY_DN7182_c0_g1_i2.p1 TRINITY_DN7182_c0_g1~~TRINITY_DN7182_c0_g1_i2.p1  ORF type:complete len:465 (+),score=50.89 TRINITY_DN7182_c0_g1_i2:55-1449(+)
MGDTNGAAAVRSEENDSTIIGVGNNEKSVVIENNDSERGILFCFQLWIRIMCKAVIICIPVLMFFWIFFTPALVLSPKMLDSVKDLLYFKLLIVFRELFYYGFLGWYVITLFGFYFSEQALRYFFLPGIILAITIYAFTQFPLIGNVIAILSLLASIDMIRRKNLPSPHSQKLLWHYLMMKNSGKHLAKIVTTIGFIFLLCQALLSTFLQVNLRGKILLRFFLFPFLMSFCTSLQLHFLSNVPKIHQEYVLQMVLGSNGMLKIFERLLTNSMFDSGDYVNFMISNFASTVVEIANHASYSYRMKAFQIFLTKFRGYIGKLRPRTVRHISVVPQSDTEEKKFMNTSMREEIEWIVQIRRHIALEDISMEFMMIFTVTFLLYFIHPLVDNEKVETIGSFQNCIIQLLIQLAFEFLGDMFGLFWIVKKQKMPIELGDVGFKNQWSRLWMTFMIWQSFHFGAMIILRE